MEHNKKVITLTEEEFYEARKKCLTRLKECIPEQSMASEPEN